MWLISWCFEASQPLRIISWLNLRVWWNNIFIAYVWLLIFLNPYFKMKKCVIVWLPWLRQKLLFIIGDDRDDCKLIEHSVSMFKTSHVQGTVMLSKRHTKQREKKIVKHHVHSWTTPTDCLPICNEIQFGHTKKENKVLQRIYLAKTQQHSLYGSK